jgi:phosphoglycolate phosphatase-like HAD superfamily hydrolase
MCDEPWVAGARKAWGGGSWDTLQGEGPDGMPNWLRAKMRLLRPVVETGYESMLLVRLCVDEALRAQRARDEGTSGSRPLTIGEITTNWGPEMRDSLLMRYGLHQTQAVEAYSRTRDEWMAEDEKEWLEANRFYDGAIDAMREAADAGSSVYIVTTKSRRYALKLLESAGVEIREEAIFGLGSGPKVDTLSELQQRHPGAQITFVEDRLDTLRKAANDPRLFGCRLYFAEWGYSTAEQQALAGSMPRVRSLTDSSELSAALCATAV